MQRNREWRRYVRERKIQQIERWMRRRDWYNPWEDGALTQEEADRKYREAAVNRHSAPKDCSCWMCGNPRKRHGTDTFKEQVFNITCKEVFAEEELPITFPRVTKRSW